MSSPWTAGSLDHDPHRTAHPLSEGSPPDRWETVTLPDRASAERLLDWLGQRGFSDRQLVVAEPVYIIRCRQRPTGRSR